MRRAEQKEGSDKQRVEEDLEEARERLDAERAAQRLAAERVEATTREVELLRADLAATKQNLDKAEGDKTRVRPPASPQCLHSPEHVKALCQCPARLEAGCHAQKEQGRCRMACLASTSPQIGESHPLHISRPNGETPVFHSPGAF